MQDYAYLLSIDTCGPTGSIALGQLIGGELHILGETSLGGQRPSETLVGDACEILRMAEVPHSQLGAIIVVNGPGGFTGVRVGLAVVKGLAESWRTPVVAVSRLEVLAAKVGVASAALDAHRHELFLRIGWPEGQARELLAGAEELAEINQPPARIAVCDDAADAILRLAWPAAELVRTASPNATDALRLCAARAAAGEFVDLALLDGNYLRRSDAEIFGEAAAEVSKNSDVGILVRTMCGMDLNEVMEIAASLKELPQWTREAYRIALDLEPNQEAAPRRMALSAIGPEPDFLLMGFAVASLTPPQAELEIIAVDKQFQRRGLARKLFEEMADKLPLVGVREVILEVRASNQAALGFYRRLGFVETGRRPGYYQAPEEDAVLMRLGLEGLESAAVPQVV
ncbi:MAG TPA: tRNA (adenosine(37)-N6)-threonylcarbamoyltransferase complex dimerization subunit type 1 TsaB [Terracidiphilus sp.]|jgi:tRNA threonylcarbamoyl adenosine modification protein YeaZ/ribosomal-protein-alanine acetyltransferase